MGSLAFLRHWAALSCLLLSLTVAAQDATIDASATPLNRHADQLGIWVNSNADTYRPEYVRKLRDDLKVKSIRHGWQYSVMDPKNPDRFLASPCDSRISPYIVSNCVVQETMPLSQIAKLRQDLSSKGYLVLGTDGIYYTGTEDATLKGMTTAQREDYYLDNARRMAAWGRDNGFRYFEIGNESDLPGEMVDRSRGTEWTGKAYGAYALRMAKAILSVYPQAQIGINGGWRKTVQDRQAWWDGILAAAPTINDYIHFVVIHKYEFGQAYTTWKDNMWSFGAVQPDNLASVAKNFPGKPIHITETSGFYNEQLKDAQGVNYTGAYRGIMNVETLGNLLTTPLIEHVQHWGTRWEDLLVFKSGSDDYNNMGFAQLSYTRFMKPHLIANNSVGTVRYFAATDPKDGSLTVWLVNHAEEDVTLQLDLANFTGSSTFEQWNLVIANGNPYSRDLKLVQSGSSKLSASGEKKRFTITVPATGVGIAAFGAGGTTTPPPTQPLTNIALRRPASQSSTLSVYRASLAVDGNTSGDFKQGSVTHTNCGTNDWWKVDLQGNFVISSIKVFNRTDFAPDRLKNYDVVILDASGREVWSTFQQATAGRPTVLSVKQVTGRYVRIRLRNDGGPCLSLAEVQVLGVAAGGTAKSLAAEGEATLPVDIYPNPSSGLLKVRVPGRFSLALFDLHGRLLLQQHEMSERTTLTLDSYPPGVYQLRLRTAEGQLAVRKVVLQR